MMMESDPEQSLLSISLQAAVPLWQMQFTNTSSDELHVICQDAQSVLADVGEASLFRTTKKR